MKETKTYITLKNRPKDNYPEYIIIHHSGGTDANPKEDTSHHTAEIMESYHLSLGWDGLGYQYVIEKDGTIAKGRPEHYHGAHCSGMNTKSIGICLAGNFDVLNPTMEQLRSATELIRTIKDKYNIDEKNIVPHRMFANKSCYGSLLDDAWGRNLLKEEVQTDPIDGIIKQIDTLRQSILALKNK